MALNLLLLVAFITVFVCASVELIEFIIEVWKQRN